MSICVESLGLSLEETKQQCRANEGVEQVGLQVGLQVARIPALDLEDVTAFCHVIHR